MKKHFIFFSGAALLLMFSVNTALAQNPPAKELPAVTITAEASCEVNTKVAKAFQNLFPGASGLKWYNVEKKYIIDFIQNDRENSVLFLKNGRMVYHITYGKEADLPASVRSIVKSSYYEENINHVYNVEQSGRNIWVISLENQKFFVMARVENDELEETQRLTKSMVTSSD